MPGVLSYEKSDHKLVKRDRKQDVIRLSVQYQIVTQFTRLFPPSLFLSYSFSVLNTSCCQSFVAIEHRDKNEDPSKLLALQVAELLQEEAVDKLSYMGWEEKEKVKDVVDLTPEQEIEEILKVVPFESVQTAELKYFFVVNSSPFD